MTPRFAVIASHDLTLDRTALSVLMGLDGPVVRSSVLSVRPSIASNHAGIWDGRRARLLPAVGNGELIEADWILGACLMIRRAAVVPVGGSSPASVHTWRTSSTAFGCTITGGRSRRPRCEGCARRIHQRPGDRSGRPQHPVRRGEAGGLAGTGAPSTPALLVHRSRVGRGRLCPTGPPTVVEPPSGTWPIPSCAVVGRPPAEVFMS